MTMLVALWLVGVGWGTATTAESPPTIEYAFDGVFADYLRSVTENWLIPAPAANPAMLEMFRDRDRKPPRALEPWAGEFVGKYLTGATQVYRLRRDARLRASMADVVRQLIAVQDNDGYLGPWPRGSRLTGAAPNVGGKGSPGGTWDAWGHYHVMLGLLLWHDETGDPAALHAAIKIGDLFCAKFLGATRPRLVDTGSTEMNLAPVHGLALLYQHTKSPRYLALAKQVVEEFAAKDANQKPLAGDYLLSALAGKEFFQSPKPRWESLHPILGLVELYRITGEPRYRQAFEHWWWSIVKLDRHNNGGFSSGEQAQGNPYHPGAIETCCTIAWLAMSVEMLKLTGNSIVADELELTTLNSGLGMHSPSGRWATYNTPMDGVRKASAHDIVFQSREGSPELNCCSVNAARSLGLVSEWAVQGRGPSLVVNWYGPGSIATTTSSGQKVRLTQKTNYPWDGLVRLQVDPQRASEFPLHLRIPYWSAETKVAVNGEPVAVKAGTYLVLSRHWRPGDVVELRFDFSLHYWVGERECQGLTSIYRGPILLTYDRRFNDMDPSEVPAIDARNLTAKPIAWTGVLRPAFLSEVSCVTGRSVRLCDFASAGQAGSPYRSWLPVVGARPTAFTENNPLRSARAKP